MIQYFILLSTRAPDLICKNSNPIFVIPVSIVYFPALDAPVPVSYAPAQLRPGEEEPVKDVSRIAVLGESRFMFGVGGGT